MSKLINGIMATATSAVLTITGVNLTHDKENNEGNNNYCIVQQDICPKVQNAVNWAIEIANDSSHGYDQNNRWGLDYDCSSLVISSFKYAGIDTGDATYTGNMCSELSDHGFSVYDFDYSQLQYGDIVLWHDYSTGNGHVELYIGDNQLVGAHINENGETIGGESGDQTGNEISVGEYYNGSWEYTIRYIPKALDYLQIPDYDNDFYAFIESDNTVLASYNDVLFMEMETGNPEEVWHFVKEENNRFSISNGSYSGSYNLYKDDTGAIIFLEVGSESSCLTSVAGTVINTEYDSCCKEQRFRIRSVSDPIHVTYDFGGKECPIREEHYNSAYSSAFDLVITGFKGWSTTPNGEKIDTTRVLIPYDHTLYAIIDENIKPTVEEETPNHNSGRGKHDNEPTTESNNKVAYVEDIVIPHDQSIYNPNIVRHDPVQNTLEPVIEEPIVQAPTTQQTHDKTNQNNNDISNTDTYQINDTSHLDKSTSNITWIPGYNIGWKLEGDVFTISGNGEMPYYFNPSDAPWISVGPYVRKVVIEEGVTTVGGQAFTYFKNMKEISLPSTIKVIGRYAFQTTSIQSISLPNKLERIEEGAFHSCKNLTSITIPNSVYDIDTYTFAECNALSNVSLSKNITSIGDGVFEKCTSLKSLVIPSGVKSIGAYSFWACNMDSLSIPQSLQSVGYGGFYDSVIRDIYYGGSESEWERIEVYNVRNQSLKHASIHYNSGL